jgi:hypothetical protein
MDQEYLRKCVHCQGQLTDANCDFSLASSGKLPIYVNVRGYIGKPLCDLCRFINENQLNANDMTLSELFTKYRSDIPRITYNMDGALFDIDSLYDINLHPLTEKIPGSVKFQKMILPRSEIVIKNLLDNKREILKSEKNICIYLVDGELAPVYVHSQKGQFIIIEKIIIPNRDGILDRYIVS